MPVAGGAAPVADAMSTGLKIERDEWRTIPAGLVADKSL